MTKHQLVTHDGELLEAPLASYLETLGATQWSSKYQVVAIMGPQSSGKSTLMNHVFGTDFQMMDESRGRSQTTKGVWLAKSPKDNAYGPTLVMDLEGTDGRERGEHRVPAARLACCVSDERPKSAASRGRGRDGHSIQYSFSRRVPRSGLHPGSQWGRRATASPPSWR